VERTIRRRRALALLATGIVVTALSFGFGHRGVHAVRSLIVPGAGLYDHRHWVLGVALTLAAVAATYAWLRWGMDWSVVAVLIAAMAFSAALAYDDHPAAQFRVSAAAHEFPLVVLVMAGLSWLRLAWRRTPIGRRHASRAVPTHSLMEHTCAASINAVAGGVSEVDVQSLRRRCRRVGIAARARIGGDPLRRDHAHARAALSLAGALDDASAHAFRTDAARSMMGVPASEPGWVRLVDGTLAAIALERSGDAEAGARWARTLNGPFELRHGHRPAALWTPIGLRGPRGATWEQAAATGLARAQGWIAVDDDWLALRTRALAAAARGNAIADDERLVAACRIWLRFVDDDQAARILGRVTVHRDPIAVALDAVATSLAPDPDGSPTLQPTWRTR
jgi:hypothetical protein